jgi:Na+-translocating ferredoxin:NAD+ oxidoreductase subunit G
MIGVLRPTWLLLALAGLSAAVLKGIDELTADRVARNAERAQAASVARLLDRVAYDNVPHRDVVSVRSPAGGVPVERVFRARNRGLPAAALIELSTREGYGGPIRLLVAVAPNGSVLGVDVLAHRETPGLGDRIQAGDPRWLDRFTGRSLDEPPASRWRVRIQGGDFDALTGATVTSRAVIRAVAGGLAFHARYRCVLYDAPAAGVLETVERAGTVCGQ